MARLEKEIEHVIKRYYKVGNEDRDFYLKIGEKFAAFCREQNVDHLRNLRPETVEIFQKKFPEESTKTLCKNVFNEKLFERYEKNNKKLEMRNQKSLGIQLHERMEELNRIGQTKHDKKVMVQQFAKNNDLYINPLKNDGIYSYSTYNAYKQTSIEFTRWLQQIYPDVKNINQITSEHAKEYLLYRQDKGLSKWTVDKDMAALNKVLKLEMTKKEIGLDRKSYKESVRSRKDAKMDKKYNPEKYKAQITIAKATGIRRQSMLKISPENFIFDRNGTAIRVKVKEKGGKTRIAKILDSYKQDVTNIINQSIKEKGMSNKIFDKYTSKIDNHAFRGEYARNLYQELIDKQGFNKADVQGYDSNVLKTVSRNLGHERISVVIQHYLR